MRDISRNVLIPLALVALACSSYGDDDGLPLQSTVTAGQDNRFAPSDVRIPVGGSVTWSFGPVAHNVIFGSPSAPEDIAGGNANKQVARTFTGVGVFDYECNLHPGMTGRVVVEDRPGYMTSP